jgi:DNA modification methylase
MITLLKGDCLEVMKQIESGSVDAIITDPPYGTTACKWDSVIDFELMWEQLNRIIKPNGAIVLFGSEPFSSALRMSNIKNYKYDIIWHKKRPSNPMLAKKQVLKIHENISIFYKKFGTYNPQGLTETDGKPRGGVNPSKTKLGFGKSIKKPYKQTHTNYPKSIQTFGTDNSKNVHPTQKPILLMEYLIKTYTNENETVLDFTMGSGSTGVACKNLNRNFIGIEQDENYFEIAKKRINEKPNTLF